MARLTAIAGFACLVFWGLWPAAPAVGDETVALPAIEKSGGAKARSPDIGLMPGVPLAPHHPDLTQLMGGIIDSGIRKDHPQIGDIVAAERDFTGEGINDDLGHGTVVALITLKTYYENAAQLSNLSKALKHPPAMAIAKIVGREPASEQDLSNRMVEAIAWLAQMKVFVVNISMAMPDGAADYSALCAAIAAQDDTLFVVAAGNRGPDAAVYPAACPSGNVMVVGAVNPDGTVPGYSGRADLVAPLPPALLSTADYFRQEGDRLLQANDLESARQAYERGLTERPTAEIRALLEYGLGYIAQDKEQDAALAHFENAAEAWPAYAEPYVALSLILISQEKFQDARTWLEKGVAAGLEDPRLLDRLARVLLDLDQPEAALVHIEKLERLQPDLDGLSDLKSVAQNMANVAAAVKAGHDPLGLLYVFAEAGDAQLVKFVIRRFKPPLDEIPAGNKVPALVIAATNGHRAAMNVLLDEGASVDRQAPGLELTALMMAANAGQEGAVQLLIGRGASLDLVDDFGFTALMFAAERGYEQAARLLLEAGADIAPRSQEQLDAGDYALKHGHQEIAALIARAKSCPRLKCAQ